MTTSKKWLKITVPCPEKLTEAVSDLLGVLSGVGVEIHPVNGGDLIEISGFFALENDSRIDLINSIDTLQKKTSEELEQLFDVYGQKLPHLATRVLEDQDWATSWQKYFTSFEIVPGLVIKPSWEDFSPAVNQQILEMDPGMAFGTGQHESTRLALSLIDSCFKDNQRRIESVLDIGTGTGILAMAAALFGAEKIIGIDNDPEAVRVASDNIRNNKLSDRVTVSTTQLENIHGVFDLVCANIVHDVLVVMAPQIKTLLAPGGHVVLAGILTDSQTMNIENIYRGLGILPVASRSEGEWTGLLLRSSS